MEGLDEGKLFGWLALPVPENNLKDAVVVIYNKKTIGGDSCGASGGDG